MAKNEVYGGKLRRAKRTSHHNGAGGGFDKKQKESKKPIGIKPIKQD